MFRYWKYIATAVIAGFISSAAAYGITAAVKRKADAAIDTAIDKMQKTDKEEVIQMTNPNINKEDENTLSELENNWTVALFGVDSRSQTKIEGNSDVIIIASLNNETGAVNLQSVYRDTCLKTGQTKYGKANSAFAYGGPKAAVNMLNENFDLEIKDYVAVDWKAVADFINMLGGVDLNVTDSEFKYINAFITETVKSTGTGSVQLEHAGYNHLDGVQAVAYARLRLMDNDFRRTERQRTVISLVLQKAKQKKISELRDIVNAILPEVSSSIDRNDVYTLAKNILRIHIGVSGGVPEENYCKTVEGASYVFPKDFSACVSKLHENLYGTKEYAVSDEVKEIGVKIDQKSSGRNGTEKRKTKETEEAVSGRKKTETDRRSRTGNAAITESASEEKEYLPEESADTAERSTQAESDRETAAESAAVKHEDVSEGPGTNIKAPEVSSEADGPAAETRPETSEPYAQ